MSPRSPTKTQEEEPPGAAPLTCVRKTGEPYTRHREVEAQIAEALKLPISTWSAREWRLETLVHLIRLRGRDNDQAVLGKLTMAFLEKAKPVVDRSSRGFGVADTEEIQIKVAEKLGDLLMQAVPTPTSEYLEIDAVTVIKQVTYAVTGKSRPKASAFSTSDRDEDGNYTPTVDRLASEGLDPAAHLLEQEAAAQGGVWRYLDAITDLRHREAFILMRLYDWPLKNGPPGAPTLCERYGKSARQIRNWINNAIEQMREAAHGAES
ncbi:hypothetical protein LJR164_004451 [Phenylobacterium sp. LjRoot164]|uniref:hypothetical protein n=1 Tax=unclassified Phenylobacterium TaxID=2640670 RepID=UPI003ECCE7AA